MTTQQPGIYKITCTANGKVYIGQSTNVSRRLTSHKYNLKNNKHTNTPLQNSFNKYGLKAFTWEPIEYCKKEVLTEREYYWMNKLSSMVPTGFNCRPAEQSQPMSSETRERLKGKKLTEEQKAHLSKLFKGKKMPPEHGAKISAAQKGKKRSKEFCKKNSELQKGKQFTNEHLEKLRQAHAKRRKPVEVKFPDGAIKEYESASHVAEEFGVHARIVRWKIQHPNSNSPTFQNHEVKYKE